MINKIHHGDCLEIMKKIPDNSINMILADPPYGTTACKWDAIIPLDLMWKQLVRIIMSNGAIVIMANQPFTTTLISSNINMFKYCWVWDKVKPSGFQLAKHRPMMRQEDVVVFGKGKISYYPIMTKREKIKKSRVYSSSECYPSDYNDERTYTERYPQSILVFSNADQHNKKHPTQKPVALFEYLIKTYTIENDIVLDFVAGSGTTGVACKNLSRNYILIEKEIDYCLITYERLQNYKSNI